MNLTRYLTEVVDRELVPSLPGDENVGSNAQGAELPASASSSPVHDDHDYVRCRSSKTVKDHKRRANSQPEAGGPESKTSSREVSSYWKVGHDARRKLCIVGFNWNSSQLRLNKLGAAKSGTSSSLVGDGRTKLKDKSSKSKLNSDESIRVVETTTKTVSGAVDKPEVVQSIEQPLESSTKRRSKVYIYKPAPSTSMDCSTSTKPISLVNKSTRRKGGSRNTLLSTIDETCAAVESICPSVDANTTLESSVPVRELHKRSGEYTIHLSSTCLLYTSDAADE